MAEYKIQMLPNYKVLETMLTLSGVLCLRNFLGMNSGVFRLKRQSIWKGCNILILPDVRDFWGLLFLMLCPDMLNPFGICQTNLYKIY